MKTRHIPTLILAIIGFYAMICLQSYAQPVLPTIASKDSTVLPQIQLIVAQAADSRPCDIRVKLKSAPPCPPDYSLPSTAATLEECCCYDMEIINEHPASLLFAKYVL